MRPYYYRDHWIEYGMVLLVIAIIIILHSIGILRPVEYLLQKVVQPVAQLTYAVRSGTVHMVSNIFTDTQAELDALRSEVTTLKTTLATLSSVEEENAVLRRQLGLQTFRDYQYVLAHVIGARSDTSLASRLLVDTGSVRGVALGAPVVIDGALIGYVTAVDTALADVMLLTDANSTIPAYLDDSGAAGLVKGDIGTARMTLTQVDREAAVSVGSLVRAVGQDGVGADLPIAEVAEVMTNDRDPYQTFILKPLTDYKDIDTVFIFTR